MKKLVPALVCLFLVIPSQARTITVDDDGPADYNNIQAAIDDSNDGDIIEVQPGVYTGDGNRDIDFNGLAITVQSTDPYDPCVVEATIIDCNGIWPDFHMGFYFHTQEDSNSVLSGLTITNGNDHSIYCDESSPTITNCIIIENVGFFGAMYTYLSNPTIKNCTFTENSGLAGGGIACIGSNPTLTNCIFSRNWALEGGGMLNWKDSSPTLTNCTFSGNSISQEGGGMLNSDNSNPTLTNCTFSGNWAWGHGGGMSNSWYSSPNVTNCTFRGNSAKEGGGMFNWNSSPTLTNCTFAGNLALRGNALACDSYKQEYPSNLQVANCVLWDGWYGGNEIWNNDGSTIMITYSNVQGVWYSNVQGGWEGEGNIDTDPCFVELGYWEDPCNTPTYPWDDFWIDGDYHLLPGSPCIDAGDNNAVPADTTDLDGDGNTAEPIPFDLDGNPRVVDGNDDGNPVVDMGAYELFHAIEVAMKFTPQALNPGSKGKWVKAHLVLPEGFAVEDVDTDSPAKIIEPFYIESGYMNVFINEENLVEIEAAFDRGDFCGNGPVEGTIKVIGVLTTGQYFCGTDTIKIINNSFEYLAVLASHWLDVGCGPPDWCGGFDVDQDSVVNFVDFAMFDDCCIEFIEE